MTRNTLYIWARRSALHVTLFISLAFLVVVCAGATRGQSSTAAQDENATVAESGVIDAVVTEVEGSRLKLAGGIVIDVSQAVLISVSGFRIDRPITPGMFIRASIVSSDPSSSTLVADTVRLRVEDEIVLSGPLQSVDLENGVITVLNKRVIVNSATSIAIGVKPKKLKVGLFVSVVARLNGTELEGKLILPNAPLPRFFP